MQSYLLRNDHGLPAVQFLLFQYSILTHAHPIIIWHNHIRIAAGEMVEVVFIACLLFYILSDTQEIIFALGNNITPLPSIDIV